MGNASKLKSSKSSASGIGGCALADGRAKASVHHDSQSNDEAGGGEGSETACFLGTQSKPRGFLAADSLVLDSDKRLFRGCVVEGGELFWVELDEDGEQEAGLGECPLGSIKSVLAVRYKVRDAYLQATFTRRGRDWTRIRWQFGACSFPLP